jgi:hypothetical protein
MLQGSRHKRQKAGALMDASRLPGAAVGVALCVSPCGFARMVIWFHAHDIERRGLTNCRFWSCSCKNGHDLGVLVCCNGARQYKFRCSGCGRFSAPVPHKLLTEFECAEAEVWKVNDPIQTPPCERCGSTGPTQEHHWAPRALFPDAHEWPMSYLCSRVTTATTGS